MTCCRKKLAWPLFRERKPQQAHFSQLTLNKQVVSFRRCIAVLGMQGVSYYVIAYISIMLTYYKKVD